MSRSQTESSPRLTVERRRLGGAAGRVRSAGGVHIRLQLGGDLRLRRAEGGGGEAVGLSGEDDGGRHVLSDLADAVGVGHDRLDLDVVGVERVGDGLGGDHEEGLGDRLGAARHRAERHAREDEEVVHLPRLAHLAVDDHLREARAAAEDRLAVREGVRVGGGDLRLRLRVREREDDRPPARRALRALHLEHLLHDVAREAAGRLADGADEDVRRTTR